MWHICPFWHTSFCSSEHDFINCTILNFVIPERNIFVHFVHLFIVPLWSLGFSFLRGTNLSKLYFSFLWGPVLQHVCHDYELLHRSTRLRTLWETWLTKFLNSQSNRMMASAHVAHTGVNKNEVVPFYSMFRYKLTQRLGSRYFTSPSRRKIWLTCTRSSSYLVPSYFPSTSPWEKMTHTTLMSTAPGVVIFLPSFASSSYDQLFPCFWLRSLTYSTIYRFIRGDRFTFAFSSRSQRQQLHHIAIFNRRIHQKTLWHICAFCHTILLFLWERFYTLYCSECFRS